ncbi:hypothetical protein [Roseovarius aestuariivivens]|uniref:hypothetical protein n=1 Tax=Roseovarius aestuariivivens TaxID=1888910 RepID=UPI00107FFC50|nr:hypothetical protein [Roseovarius aestuariivivens]
MPEDCLIGFDFKAETTYDRDATLQLAGEVTRLQHVRTESGETSLDIVDQTEVAQTTDMATWDDNVPPDFTDSFDFMLL